MEADLFDGEVSALDRLKRYKVLAHRRLQVEIRAASVSILLLSSFITLRDPMRRPVCLVLTDDLVITDGN